jgi:hypothetical protein
MAAISIINWHDCVIKKIVEIPEEDRLIFEVDYPVAWETGKYEVHYITFSGIYRYQIHEGPFSGPITITDFKIQEGPDAHGATSYQMDTNAGYRIIKCRDIVLTKGTLEGYYLL